MRSKKELYQLALDNFDSIIKDFDGICIIFNKLYYSKIITIKETEFILKDFISKKPKQSWFNFLFYGNSYIGGVYWWKNNSAGNKQRKKFLKRLIDKL